MTVQSVTSCQTP